MNVTDHYAAPLSDLDREVVRHVPPGGNWRDLPENFASRRIEQIRRSAAAGEGSRSTYYGRLRWDRPSYTISTYFNRPGNGCFIHPRAERLISIREAARLQGFPDSFRFAGKGRSRFVQVGNAVPPLLAYQLGRAMSPGAFVDLFSGAGGLSMGFEWAGHELVAAVDNDAASLTTLARNGIPSERLVNTDLSDPRALEAALTALREAACGGLDLLIGGPPCQGFSTAGKNRMDDPRNRLVHAFLRAAERLRPGRVLMENVPALMYRRRRPVIDAIIQRLNSLGYDVAIAVLHAEGYGVPQMRRRLFISASRSGPVSWPIPQFVIRDPAQRALQPTGGHAQSPVEPRDVRQAISDLPDEASSDPEVAVPYGTDANPFQAWARGERPIETIIPTPTFVSDSPRLPLAA